MNRITICPPIEQATAEALAGLTTAAEATRTLQSENLQRVVATLTMLGHIKSYAHQNNTCATCERAFADKRALEAFLRKQVSAYKSEHAPSVSHSTRNRTQGTWLNQRCSGLFRGFPCQLDAHTTLFFYHHISRCKH